MAAALLRCAERVTARIVATPKQKDSFIAAVMKAVKAAATKVVAEEVLEEVEESRRC